MCWKDGEMWARFHISISKFGRFHAEFLYSNENIYSFEPQNETNALLGMGKVNLLE